MPIKYFFRNTNNDTGCDTGVDNRDLSKSSGSTVNIEVAAEGNTSFTQATVFDTIVSGDNPSSGLYTYSVDVTQVRTASGRLRLQQLNSSCTVLSNSVYSPGWSTAAVATGVLSLNWTTGDRLRVSIESIETTDCGQRDFFIDLNDDTDSFIIAPFSAVGGSGVSLNARTNAKSSMINLGLGVTRNINSIINCKSSVVEPVLTVAGGVSFVGNINSDTHVGGRNQPPTIDLINQALTSIAEDADVSTPTFVAEILVQAPLTDFTTDLTVIRGFSSELSNNSNLSDATLSVTGPININLGVNIRSALSDATLSVTEGITTLSGEINNKSNLSEVSLNITRGINAVVNSKSILTEISLTSWIGSTVGNSSSGADYAADVGALQLWENDIDGGTAGDYAAKIITDIVDDLFLSGFTAGTWKLWIYGDVKGTNKRIISVQSSGADPIALSDTNISELRISDLEMDGTNQGASRRAIFLSSSSLSILTVERVIIHHTTDVGIRLLSAITAGVYKNVLMYSCGRHGFDLTYVDAANTHNFYNCASYKNDSVSSNADGFSYSDDANISCTFWNCIALNNKTEDWSTETTANVHLHNCVSSDGTANDAAHDTTDNCVDSQTDYTAYFDDWNNNDFHLTRSDDVLWGINGDSTNTPSVDLDNITRTNYDIGPYELTTSDILVGIINAKSILESLLGVAFNINGRIDSKSKLAETTLKTTKSIDSNINANSNITNATLNSIIGLNGEINAESSLISSLNVTKSINALVNNKSRIETLELQVVRNLIGLINSKSNLTEVSLTTSSIQSISGRIDSSSIVESTLEISRTFSSTINSESSIAETILLRYFNTSGNIDSHSNIVNSTLQSTASLSGEINGKSVVEQTLGVTRNVNSLINSKSSAEISTLQITRDLTGRIDCKSKIVESTTEVFRTFSSNVNSKSSVNETILLRKFNISGEVDSNSNIINSTLQSAVNLNSEINVKSAVEQNLSVAKNINTTANSKSKIESSILKINRNLVGRVDVKSKIVESTPEIFRTFSSVVNAKSSIEESILLRNINLNGNINSESSVDEIPLNIATKLNAVLSSTSSVAESIINILTSFSGNVNSSSAVESLINLLLDLQSNINAKSSIEDLSLSTLGSITFVGYINSQSKVIEALLNVQRDLDATVGSKSILENILGVLRNINGNINSKSFVNSVSLDLTKPVNANINAKSNVFDALLFNNADLQTSVNSASSVISSLNNLIGFSGEISSRSSIQDSDLNIGGQITLESSINSKSSLQNTLSVNKSLSTRIDSKSNVVEAILNKNVVLVGSVNSKSNIVESSLRITKALNSLIHSKSSLETSIGVTRNISSNVNGKSSISAAVLNKNIIVNGIINGKSSSVSSLGVIRKFTSNINGKSSVSGIIDVGATISLSSSIDSKSSVFEVNITSLQAFSGTLNNKSSLDGQFILDKASLGGDPIFGVSLLRSSLSVAGFAGIINANGQAEANLLSIPLSARMIKEDSKYIMQLLAKTNRIKQLGNSNLHIQQLSDKNIKKI